MATYIFTDPNTDMSVAANWTGGVEPAASDVGQVHTGSQAITVGPDNDLNGLDFGPNFRGSFAGTVQVSGSTSPNAVPTLFVNSASSYMNFTAGAAGVDRAEIAPLSGEVRLVSGTFVTVLLFRGTLYVEGAATVTTIYNLGGTLTLATGAGTSTTLHHKAGLSIVKRNLTTANCDGGELRMVDNSEITTLNLNGGTFYFNSIKAGADPTAVTLGTATISGAGASFMIAGARANPVATSVVVNAVPKYFQTRSGSVRLTAAITNNVNATQESDPAGGGGGGVFLGVTGW